MKSREGTAKKLVLPVQKIRVKRSMVDDQSELRCGMPGFAFLSITRYDEFKEQQASECGSHISECELFKLL